METNLEKFQRLVEGGKQSSWLEEAKKREKYRLYYDIKFYLALKRVIMKKAIRRFYFKRFPTYKRIDFKVCTWDEGDKLIKSHSKPNSEWRIADEDMNYRYPLVALELRERIIE